MKKFFWILFISSIFVACNQQNKSLTKIKATNSAIDSSFVMDSSIVNVYNPFKAKMIEKINEKLTYTPKDVTRFDGKMQSTLGNYLADACYVKANEIFMKEKNQQVDFAMFNYGGIRAGISKGTVTYENAFKLMPFENTLVVTELSYDKVVELFDYFYQNKKAQPISKQVEITLTNKGLSVKLNGKQLDKNKTYFVATSNYLQTGGDRMNFFKDPIYLFETNYLMRKAIIESFKSKDTLVTQLDNRVIVK